MSDPLVFLRDVVGEAADADIVEVAFQWQVARAVAVDEHEVVQSDVALKTVAGYTLKDDLHSETSSEREFDAQQCTYAVFIGDIVQFHFSETPHVALRSFA